MKISTTAVCLCSLAGLFLVGATANAASSIGNSSSGPTLGAHAGAGLLGDGGGLQFDLGLSGTYPLSNSPLFLGGDFSWVDRGKISTDTTSTSASLYLLNGSLNYDTSGSIPNSFLGVAMGLGWNHASTNVGGTATSNTNSSFYLGPRAGVDFPFSSSFTIGGQADWLIATGNSPNVLELLAVVKWWL